MAKYENISPKEGVDIKEFRPKWEIYLPVIRCYVAMVTADPEIDNQKIKIFTGKTLR